MRGIHLRLRLLIIINILLAHWFCAHPLQAQSDLSSLFNQLYDSDQSEKFTRAELEELSSQYKITMIPGYFSNFTIKMTPIGYFDSALAALNKHDMKEGPAIETARLVTYSQLPSEFNKDQIIEHLKESTKKVIFVTHSKGGIDFLKAILQHPELEEKVGGFISIQGPFFGSELADRILSSRLLRPFFRVLLPIFGGNIESLREFSTEVSKKFMEDNQEKISKLKFPILNFASYLGENEVMSFGVLRPFQRMTKDLVDKSDGIVPTKNAVIPGRCYIERQGMDHTDPVVGYGSRVNRRKLIASLLKVFLKQFPSKFLEEAKSSGVK